MDEKHKLGGYLLAVYELLYLNNNFMQSIFHETEAPHVVPKASSQPKIAPPTTNTDNINTTGTNDSDLIVSTTVESMGDLKISETNNNGQNNDSNSTGKSKESIFKNIILMFVAEPKSLGSMSVGSGPIQPRTPRRLPIVPELLVSYLKLAAVVFSSAKDTRYVDYCLNIMSVFNIGHRNLQHTKAVLLTLLVLVEDSEVCRLIHDEKLVAVVAFIKINTQVKSR